MNLRTVSSLAVLTAALSSTVGCQGEGVGDLEIDSVAEALTPSTVANMAPAGLVESTGNLYWTRNTLVSVIPRRYTNTVYRASKGSVPGQEAVLYSEQSSSAAFGNIAFG